MPVVSTPDKVAKKLITHSPVWERLQDNSRVKKVAEREKLSEQLELKVQEALFPRISLFGTYFVDVGRFRSVHSNPKSLPEKSAFLKMFKLIGFLST